MSNVSIFQNVAFHRFPDRERGSFLRRNRGHDTPSAKRKTKKTYPIHIVADKTVTTKSPTSTRLSNRINPVNIEESQSLWNFASFHAPAPSQSLSPPIPIGCSVEMPSRNHPSRLIESLTLMNIGSDRRARGTLFSPCLLSLPLPSCSRPTESRTLSSMPTSCMLVRSCNYEAAARGPRNDRGIERTELSCQFCLNQGGGVR